jgi:hypothetical protein
VFLLSLSTGWGSFLTLVLSVGGQATFNYDLAYNAPSISSVSLISASSPIPTTGLDGSSQPIKVRVIGTDFYIDGGTLSYTASASSLYATSYYNMPCTMSVTHTELICELRPGVGTAFQFQVQIHDQGSQNSWPSLISYAAPSLASGASQLLFTSPLRTDGGIDSVTLQGSNFGQLEQACKEANAQRTTVHTAATSRLGHAACNDWG